VVKCILFDNSIGHGWQTSPVRLKESEYVGYEQDQLLITPIRVGNGSATLRLSTSTLESFPCGPGPTQ